jgi:hypothetical protein
VTDKEEMLQILDFILNRSTRGDLEVIQEAVKRRIRDIRTSIAGVDVRAIARKTADSIQKQLGSAEEVGSMIRRFIRDLIKQQQPDISEEDLEKLLDRCLPASSVDEEQSVSGFQEDKLPPDMIQSMLVQFIDYSLGRMSKADKKDLAPDWHTRYWEAFSPRLKRLLSDLLKEKISESVFWEEYKEI